MKAGIRQSTSGACDLSSRSGAAGWGWAMHVATRRPEQHWSDQQVKVMTKEVGEDGPCVPMLRLVWRKTLSSSRGKSWTNGIWYERRFHASIKSIFPMRVFSKEIIVSGPHQCGFKQRLMIPTRDLLKFLRFSDCWLSVCTHRNPPYSSTLSSYPTCLLLFFVVVLSTAITFSS